MRHNFTDVDAAALIEAIKNATIAQFSERDTRCYGIGPTGAVRNRDGTPISTTVDGVKIPDVGRWRHSGKDVMDTVGERFRAIVACRPPVELIDELLERIAADDGKGTDGEWLIQASTDHRSHRVIYNNAVNVDYDIGTRGMPAWLDWLKERCQVSAPVHVGDSRNGN